MSPIKDNKNMTIYRDRWGMTSLKPGKGTQNGVLFSVEELLVMLRTQPLEVVKTRALELKQIFDSLELVPGVLTRSPGSKEYDSMDNYTARLVFQILANKLGIEDHFAENMIKHNLETKITEIDLDYWEFEKVELSKKFFTLAKVLGFGRPRHCYNAHAPGKFCLTSWWGRSPALLALMDIAAGKKTINPIRWLGLFVGQILGLFPKPNDLDSPKLNYLTWQALQNRSFIWKTLYKIWESRVLSLYPEGMKTVYDRYYKNNPEHPIRQLKNPF